MEAKIKAIVGAIVDVAVGRDVVGIAGNVLDIAYTVFGLNYGGAVVDRSSESEGGGRRRRAITLSAIWIA